MLRVFKSSIDFLKKAFLVVGVFFIIFAIFGNVINNNKPRIDDEAIIAAQQKKLYAVLDDKKINSTKTGKVALAIYRFSYCSLIGELCTEKPVAGDSNFKTSLLGKVSSLIALPYKYPPASGTFWVRNTLEKAGFIPQSLAAEGIGFSSIKPLMNLWIVFRDVAYLIIVVVLVSIGFMIMFRMKINPQTVISVENSLPKIVVALLLITFSFAIAGFLIDMMYLLILLAINILSFGEKYYSTAKVQSEFLNSGLGTLWEYILPYKTLPSFNLGPLHIQANKFLWMDSIPFAREVYLGDALASFIPYQVNLLIRGIALTIIPILAGYQISQMVKLTGATSLLNNLSVFGNGVGAIPQFFIGVPLTMLIYVALIGVTLNGFGFFLGIIVTLTVTAMFFNIFFMLFRSYLQIIVVIIFAPIILLFEAIPGKSTFQFWFIGLIGELITFPLVITMLLVGKILITTLSYPGDYWRAPFIGHLNTEGFGVIFGAGFIFIIPDIVKFVKEAIGVKPLPFNIGVGTFLGGAGTVGGGAMGIFQHFSTLSLGISGIGTLRGMIPGKKADSNKDSAGESEEAMTKRLAAEDALRARNLASGGKL